MANMTVNDRNGYERIELSVPHTGVRVRNRKPLVAFTAIAIALLAVLLYATVEAVDGWSHAVVLAAIVLTAVGAMIALDPKRRG